MESDGDTDTEGTNVVGEDGALTTSVGTILWLGTALSTAEGGWLLVGSRVMDGVAEGNRVIVGPSLVIRVGKILGRRSSPVGLAVLVGDGEVDGRVDG